MSDAYRNSEAATAMAEGMDFAAHNAAVRVLWVAYREGRHRRVPMILGMNARLWLLDPALNREAIGFDAYMNDPRTMADVQVRFQHYHRHHLVQDREMGVPAEGWALAPDGQNVWEAEWLGNPRVSCPPGREPFVQPFLDEESLPAYLRSPLPGPFDGAMRRAWAFYDHFLAMREAGYTFAGAPIGEVSAPGCWTDGPLTMAVNLAGESVLMLMLTDRPLFDALLERITGAVVARVRACRARAGDPPRTAAVCLAEDALQMLSVEQYVEYVLPYHRRLVKALGAPGGRHYMHLCGDGTRHFRTMRDELGVYSFDTGFPVDFGRLRAELGEEVEIAGGVHAALLKDGTPDAVYAEARRILESGVTRGGRFFLRDANNLAPRTPPDNVEAMYRACLEYGGLPASEEQDS